MFYSKLKSRGNVLNKVFIRNPETHDSITCIISLLSCEKIEEVPGFSSFKSPCDHNH